MELTRKKLLELAQILDAVEIEVGDRDVAKMRLSCVAYSWGKNGYCTGRLYKNQNGYFFVVKTYDAACYVAQFL